MKIQENEGDFYCYHFCYNFLSGKKFAFFLTTYAACVIIRAKMKKKRKKPGPKPRPLEEKYSARMTVWMTPEEYRLLEQEARKQGITTSVLLMRPFRHKGKE